MRNFFSLMKVAVILLFIFSSPSRGQSQTVSGTVQDADKKTPLVGVSIKVNGTNTVDLTNENGSFTIKASIGQVLVISYIGYESKKVTVTGAKILVSLKSQTNELDDVVVVAMDIKKKPRELGYSVANVSGKEVQETQRENFLNSFQGRVSGVTVSPTSGSAGASTSIVLRGFNSLALDNQPLFVVDGVIMDNQTVNETSNGGSQLGLASDKPNRNNDYTNRISDINPNDIESYTVLKGPEATALYGSQASSGAIIITTKKAKNLNGNITINYDNAFRLSELTRYSKVSNNFQPGTNGVASAPGQVFTYFGPTYPTGTTSYNNPKSFFKPSFSQTHNLSMEFGKKNFSFRVAGSMLNQDGIIPQNTYKKYTLRITNFTKIGKYIDITPSFTYTNSSNDKPIRGAGGFLLNLLVWPSTDDVSVFTDASGNRKPLYNNLSPNSELDNPLWSVKNNKSQDKLDRYTSTLGINITPNKWLNISGRFGYDIYKQNGFTFYNPLSYFLTKGNGGAQDNYYKKYNGYNHTITATAKKQIGDFSTRIMVGTMWQDYKTEQFSVYGTNIVDSVNSAGQMVKNLTPITDANFGTAVGTIGDSSITRASTRVRLSRSTYGDYNYVLNRQLAYFAEASIGYKNYIFLTYSHRFETSSIFPADYRKYNYPAGSLSFILSDIFPQITKGNIINYAKLRASLASTARASAPYANQSVFNTVLSSGGGYAYAFNNNNYLLEPERQHTFEIGTELKLWNSRVSFDITYYNTKVDKQIAENFRASYATGYVLNTLNVGSTRNQGIELGLDIAAIRNKEFSWNVRFSFNKMWNKVLTLPANVPEFYISDTWLYQNARAGLVQGGSTTTITSFGYLRNNNGDILIDPTNGVPLVESAFKKHGDRNPNFSLGTLNSFRYKNWSLSFLWDLKVGGDIFNGTDMYLTKSGKSLRTDDRNTPRVVTGVLKDGLENTAKPTVNTMVVTPNYMSTLYYDTRMPDEEFIQHNVNWFRLRDISLVYNFSQNFINKRNHLFKSLSAFLTANDLILITNYKGADPSVSGNTAATRGTGAWGFDYGTVPAPVSINFGIRTSF